MKTEISTEELANLDATGGKRIPNIINRLQRRHDRLSNRIGSRNPNRRESAKYRFAQLAKRP